VLTLDVPLQVDDAAAVVSSGVFTHGHVGGEAFAELCRITKPGGVIAVTQRLDLVDEHPVDTITLRRRHHRVNIVRRETTLQLSWHSDDTAQQLDVVPERNPGQVTIDMPAVRAFRLDRVRTEMANYGVDACILFDPVNVRYATGSRNMQVFTSRNPARYLFVPLDGPVILFEFTGCEHLSAELETIDEIRPAVTASFVAAGDDIAGRERLWAREMAAVVRRHCGAGATVGIERVNAGAAVALGGEGFAIVDAQQPVERARAVKSDEELKCVVASIRATERGVARLRDAIRPGQTEQELWSVLHQSVIAQGGDYIETRLLNSGERTNPWFQETSGRVIQPNELIALDTDVVGCHGYYADFSRTFHSGPDEPTAAQRESYALAYEQVHHNMGIIRAGVTFKEYSERAWDIPARFEAHRYYLSAHGVGMTGEYPYLFHHRDYAHSGYDGVFVPNMTICVESFIGDDTGGEGVKLEQHCLITDSGLEVLSEFPFEDSLLTG
jgi:Xaa-Pro aminopeptidase